jgi:hypothetical protein
VRARRITAGLMIVLLGTSLSGCAALRDAEPFTKTVIYDEDPATGRLTVEPLNFDADWSYGEIQVLNRTEEEHGFAIRELAVFEKIPKGLQRTVNINEARDGRTYTFECHLHPNEFFGRITVNYKDVDERE